MSDIGTFLVTLLGGIADFLSSDAILPLVMTVCVICIFKAILSLIK